MRVLFIVLAAGTLMAAASERAAAQPARGDCVEIAVQSNGFHTSLLMPGEALDPRHPMRRLFPDAQWLAAGWGDEDFFREPDGGTFAQGLRAAFPGGSTVVHAVALNVAPEEFFLANPPSRIALTRAAAADLARFLEQEIVRTPDGDAEIVAAGHHRGQSYFLRGRNENFSLFNNCNHWTARGLRAAGLRVSGILTERDVMDQVRKLASTCASAPAPDGV